MGSSVLHPQKCTKTTLITTHRKAMERRESKGGNRAVNYTLKTEREKNKTRNSKRLTPWKRKTT